MGSKTITGPGRHSKRVEAWIYTIMNPLIESLLRENRLLEEGNLSWRWDRRRCEYIRAIAEYIESAYWPNYEDFLADNGDFKNKFEKHDSAVSALETKASEFCDVLLHSPIFLGQVSKSLEAYESRVNARQPQYQSLLCMKEDVPKYVAEALINRVKSLPHHYTLHKYWEDYAREFDLSKLHFEPYKKRQAVRSLEQAANSLQQITSGLRRDLEDHRLMLCRKYDIPAAPLLPARNFSEDALSFSR